MVEISNMKVVELKEELTKRGLPTNGLKADLAGRLTEAVAQDGPTAEPSPAPLTSPSPRPEDEGPSSNPTSDPMGDPLDSAKGDPREQTPPPVVEAAKEDDSIPVDDEEIKEQVLGDTDGDLGEAMGQAAEQGKEERKAEEEGAGGQMGEGSGVVGNKDEGGVEQDQAEIVNTGEAEAEAGDKRKREDGDLSMDVDAAAKKARTGEGEMQMDVRTEDDTPSAPSRDPTEDVPNPLPHARHPPTKALYIDNFRRPLDVPALKELLEDQGELDSTEVSGGVWVSGVKSHVYVMYKTLESATKAGLALHDLEFQPIAKTRLHVEFVPSTLVKSLIEQEEDAWKAGRKQMTLVIQTVPAGEGHEGSSRKVSVVPVNQGANVPGRRVSGLANAPPPPTPFRARPGVAGIGGAPVVQPRVSGPVSAVPSRYDLVQGKVKGNSWEPPARAKQGPPIRPERETRGFLKTRARPVLFYREAPRK